MTRIRYFSNITLDLMAYYADDGTLVRGPYRRHDARTQRPSLDAHLVKRVRRAVERVARKERLDFWDLLEIITQYGRDAAVKGEKRQRASDAAISRGIQCHRANSVKKLLRLIEAVRVSFLARSLRDALVDDCRCVINLKTGVELAFARWPCLVSMHSQRASFRTMPEYQEVEAYVQQQVRLFKNDHRELYLACRRETDRHCFEVKVLPSTANELRAA